MLAAPYPAARRISRRGSLDSVRAEHVSVPVPPDLRPAIAGWTGYRYDGLAPGSHLGLPSPALTLVISLGAPTKLAATPDPGQRPAAFAALIGGLHLRPAVIEYDTELYGIQVNLTPAGARLLLGMPAGALSPAVVHLEDVVGRAAPELVEQLADAPDWPQRFGTLVAALRRLARRALPAPHVAVDAAWRQLAGDPAARVADTAAAVGYSRRHLNERFRAEYGVSPKQAARIARFDRARRALQVAAPPSLASAAALAGYYDQAHMAREWNELAGCPPSRWLADEVLPNVQDGVRGDAQTSAA
jgi:AraC-like DNA-binding protein